MDDFILLVIEVQQTTQDLTDDQSGFLLREGSVLFEVHVQVHSTTELQYSAEWVVIDLNRVKLPHHSRVDKLWMNFIFSHGMSDVVLLQPLIPVVVKVVDLTGNLSVLIKIKCLVHLGVTSSAQEG